MDQQDRVNGTALPAQLPGHTAPDGVRTPRQPGRTGDEDDGDVALLRQYAPVMAYTAGERFFPLPVEPYVAACGLWAVGDERRLVEIVPAGELDTERLRAESAARRGQQLSLRLVRRSSGKETMRDRWNQHPLRPRGVGRLAAVGLLTRLVDVLVRISLLLRGRVPGGVAAGVARLQRERFDHTPRTCYGRVVRIHGYVVLQYWTLYAMNDWRSTFAGVNDHEADWELVAVYLADNGDRPPQPMWVAASAHDETGDDLRRRWDDPELRRDGNHPVVFSAAGSHSGAFLPGDYLVSVDPEILRPLVRWVRRAGTWLPGGGRRTRQWRGLRVPYIDYARGDGQRVGPGSEHPWDVRVIDDTTAWARSFRGLWGLDTRDRFGGERAPAGPRYERDGTIRQSWGDPLGWCGLQKVAPDDTGIRAHLAARLADLNQEIDTLNTEINTRGSALRRLWAEAASLRQHAHAARLAEARTAKVAALEQELRALERRRAKLTTERDAHRTTLETPGLVGPPGAHLNQPRLPYEGSHQLEGRRGRFLRIWAALSTPLLVAALAVLLLRPVGSLLIAFMAVLGFTAVEATARRRLGAFLLGLALLVLILALTVAVIAAFILDWRITLATLLGAAALLLLGVNLRELLRR